MYTIVRGSYHHVKCMLGRLTLGRHDVDVDLLGAERAPQLPLGSVIELHLKLGDVRLPRPDQPEVLLCWPACMLD